MTDKKTEALKLALEALKMCRGLIRNNIENLVPIASPNPWFSQDVDHAITAIREALAEQPAQQQEPVAWMVDVDLANYQGQSEYRTILAWNAKPVHSGTYEINEVLKAVPLYTSPPNVPTARASKPLTDEEIKRLKPISADFVSFRAGVRCMEREYRIGEKR